jgi:hypothetical protein
MIEKYQSPYYTLFYHSINFGRRPKRKRPLGRMSIDWRILLKGMLNKCLDWIQLGNYSEQSNEFSGFVKDK